MIGRFLDNLAALVQVKLDNLLADCEPNDLSGMTHDQTRRMYAVVGEVLDEREAQHVKWGEQNHRDGTGPENLLLLSIGASSLDDNEELAEAAKVATDTAARLGRVTYAHILTEEWAEAMAEEDPNRLRNELLQVAAVAVAWVEKLDREAGQ